MKFDSYSATRSVDSLYVDFDRAMGAGSGYFRQMQHYTTENKEMFQYFRTLYEKNNLLRIPANEFPKIPKIIHQIWIGRRPLPADLKKTMETWNTLHPNWEIRFWTNEAVRRYEFGHVLFKDLFQRPLTMGERVDILRYDILWKYGGVYADTDVVCLRNFDPLVHRYDFFGALCPPYPPSLPIGTVVQNCLIGCKPHHPILEELAKIVFDGWNLVVEGGDEFMATLNRTFLVLVQAFRKGACREGNIDIAMPAGYFIPVNERRLADLLIRGPIEVFCGLFDESKSPFSRIKQYSFAMHNAETEWAYDLLGSTNIRKLWWNFNFKDWIRIFRARWAPRSSGGSPLRQTFEQMLSGQ